MATNTNGGTTASLSNTPQAKDDAFIAGEDQILYFDVMANDLGGNAKVLWSIDNTSDDGATDLVARDVANVIEYSELGAKVSLTSDGKIKYDTTLLDGLAAGQTVTDQFTYAIRMSNGTLSWATVTITLTGTNDAPVAVDDNGSGNEDSSISGSVAINDSDVDAGAVLSYAVNGAPPAGFAMDGAGSWSLDATDAAYQHIAQGAYQDVVVSYTVTDEHGASDTATLTIRVHGVNDDPVATDDSGSGNEDGLISGSVAANDDDVDDGAVLSYAVNGAAPAGFAMDGDGNWSLDSSDAAYQHITQGAYEDIVVSYTVTDEHGASGTATLTVRVYGVNDDPVALDDNGSGNEDAVISGSVAANDDDVDDGATLSYAVNGTAPAGFAMDGDGNWSLDASDAAYQHIAQGAYQDVVVSYTVTDEFGGSDTASLTVRVYGVNDDPVALDDNGGGNEDSLIAGSVAANDDDVDDGAVLSYAVNGVAPAGFSMDGDGNWSLDASDSAYQHIAQGAYQDVVVSYTVTDEFGGSDTASLTIRVFGVNDNPVALDDNGSGNEDSLISGSVAANDDDVDDGAVLSYAVNGTAPAGFLMDGDGAWSLDSTNAAYQHIAQGAYQDVVVSYTVTDEFGGSDTATLTIRVHGVNDDPVALDDNGSGNEDNLISGSVAANDDDADDGATLSYAVNGTTPAGFLMDGDGSWSLDASDAAYQHIAQGAYEDVVVSYTVTDEFGGSDTATLTIRVHGANDDPELAGTQATLADGAEDLAYIVSAASLLQGFSDVDDGTVLAVSGLTADHGSVVDNGDGTYTVTPDANYNGLVTLSYSVVDGDGGSVPAALSFNLVPVNDPAEISAVAGGDYDVVEAGGVDNGSPGDWAASGQVSVTDIDPGEAVFQNPPSLDGIYGTFAFDPATGNWSYELDNSRTETEELAEGAIVTDTLTVTSADGTAAYDIVVTITGTNDAALIVGDTAGSVTEAASSNPGTPTATGTLSLSDADSPQTFQAQGSTATASGYGSFTMTAAGVWTYTLNNLHPAVDGLSGGDTLTDTFDVQSADGTIQTITVTINGADDAIVITPPPTYNGAGDPNDFDALLAASAVAGGPTTVNGGSGADSIHGSNSGSADTLNGGNGVDSIYGHDGGDNINGQNGSDMSLYGQAGDDIIAGGSGSDQIFGGSGADTIYGNEAPAGNSSGDAGDTIYGGSGNDTIYGQAGNDSIIGGYGADTLTGGGGIDFFVYLSLLDTNDTIADFTGTDKIDVSAIDADPLLAGNQAFQWGGEAPTPYGLWFSYDGGTNTTTLYGDIDGDPGTAEFMLTLLNFNAWGAAPPSDIIF